MTLSEVQVNKVREAKKAFKERDRVIRALSEDGTVRVAAIRNSKSVQTAQKKHELSPLSAVLLGRLMSGASMLSAFLKGEERIILETLGNGPVGKMYAEAMEVGEVRGYVEHPYVMPNGAAESLEIGDVVGIGLFRVSKILYNKFEPIVGVVDLIKGDIQTDLAYYLRQSEQIPSAVLLDVQVDDAGVVTQSGGIIVQAMPGASEESLASFVEKLETMEPLHELYENGYNPEDVLDIISPAPLATVGNTRLDFFCRCSLDRFKSHLRNFSPEEIRQMQEQGQSELVCRYCNEHYYLTDKDFEELLLEVTARNN